MKRPLVTTSERDREELRTRALRRKKAALELAILALVVGFSWALSWYLLPPGTVAPASRPAASAGVFFEKERGR